MNSERLENVLVLKHEIKTKTLN